MKSKQELHELAETIRDPEKQARGRVRGLRNPRWWALAVIGAAIAGVAVWGWRTVSRQVPVESTVADYRRFGPAADAYLRSTGYVDYPERHRISAQAAGVVQGVRVREGDLVEAGDVLAELDDRVARLREDAARLGVERARADLDVARARWQAGTGVEWDVERARIEWESARAQWRLAQTELDLLRVVSPVGGRVLEVLAREGERAAGALLEVADTGRVWIRTDVRQEDVARVRIGGAAVAVLDAEPDVEWAGRVSEVAAKADRTGNTVEVRIELDPPGTFLQPELSASVLFTREGRQGHGKADVALALEERFVQRSGEEAWVWLRQEGRVARRTVRTGEGAEGLVRILDGLQVGDVVVRGVREGELKEGDRIREAVAE